MSVARIFPFSLLWLNNMALEQLPDVALQRQADFTLSTVSSAYKEAQKLGFFSCQESLEVWIPKHCRRISELCQVWLLRHLLG